MRLTEFDITIEYRLYGEDAWRRLHLATDAYFDPDWNDDVEELEFDSVPRYDHAVEYLDVKKESVWQTRLTVIHKHAQTKRVITETFWNSGQNRIIERADTGPALSDWEMIISVTVPGNIPCDEILRIGRDNDLLTPTSHCFIRGQGEREEIIEVSVLREADRTG